MAFLTKPSPSDRDVSAKPSPSDRDVSAKPSRSSGNGRETQRGFSPLTIRLQTPQLSPSAKTRAIVVASVSGLLSIVFTPLSVQRSLCLKLTQIIEFDIVEVDLGRFHSEFPGEKEEEN